MTGGGPTRDRKSGKLKDRELNRTTYQVTIISVDHQETTMRLPFLLAAAAVTTAAMLNEAPTYAQSARSYPFCAVYSNKGGTPSCYFATREQCLADISGVGGLCTENLSYHPIAAAAAPRRRHATGRSHQ
jgi:hypothetical protein